KILKKKIIVTYIGFSAFMVVLFISVVKFNNRYKQVETVIENYNPHDSNRHDTFNAEEENSTNTRLRIWSYALELIKQHPLFGVGTGDVKDELEIVYKQHNYIPGILKHFNSHNQFLQTCITLGLCGMVILFLIFIV